MDFNPLSIALPPPVIWMGMKWIIALLAASFLPAAWSQPMLPAVMGNPSKLSADRFLNDEDPSVARDAQGRVWVAWYSCRTASSRLPADKLNLPKWVWEDDGKDVVVARWFDGKNWSDEQMVSAEPGVNWRPVVLPIIFGGWHPSLVTAQTLREDFVDIVVRHQG